MLSEVLADPIVLAIIAGDGTTRGDVESLIATVRRRLANTRITLGERPRSGAMTVGEE